MLRQFWTKHRKIIRAWRRDGRPYDQSWWDAEFYDGEITDRNTIWRQRGLVQAAMHYASIESIVLPRLQRQPLSRIVDLGSGAGHWLRFYQSLGAEAVGCDVSGKCVTYLRAAGFRAEHGTADAVLPSLGKADVVNAIGVMFHVVDDAEWERTIRLAFDALNPGGVFIVGGHFGWLDGVNLQLCADGSINKRLRSARHWRRALRDAGFGRVVVARNRAYLRSTEPLPEGNVLFAYK